MGLTKTYKDRLLPKHSGKKVSCSIRNTFIKEALLIENNGSWYILQNEESGHSFHNYKKYGYKYAYNISSSNQKGDFLSDYPFLDLVFLNSNNYELWD